MHKTSFVKNIYSPFPCMAILRYSSPRISMVTARTVTLNSDIQLSGGGGGGGGGGEGVVVVVVVVGGGGGTKAALPPGKRPATHFTGGWVGPGSVWKGPENTASSRVRTPDCLACSKSIYRLRYPGYYYY
jgi:hypothetical protein